MYRSDWARIRSGAHPRASRPKVTFWLTVSHGRSAKFWKTIAISWQTLVTGLSRKKIWPELGWSRPWMSRRRVDLPHPEGPTIARKSASFTSNVIPSMIDIEPWRPAKLLPTWSRRISAIPTLPRGPRSRSPPASVVAVLLDRPAVEGLPYEFGDGDHREDQRQQGRDHQGEAVRLRVADVDRGADP